MNQFQMEINVLRVRKGLSMHQLAKSMNCDRKTLYRAFNGKKLSLDIGAAMCSAVGATVEEVNELVKKQEELSK